MAKKLFKEKQRFRDFPFLILLGALLVLFGYQFVHLLVAGGIPSVFMKGMLCLGTMVLLLGLIWYYWNIKLTVSVSRSGISYKMLPWQKRKRHIPWEEVKSCEIVQTPKAEQWHGGNITFNHEKRFSVSGRNGIHITTNSGDELFIGSKRPEELKKAVEKGINFSGF